jgi:hypothetical protein
MPLKISRVAIFTTASYERHAASRTARATRRLMQSED